MIYIALKRMKLGPDDWREFGDEVPEAAGWSWQLLHTYKENGLIEVHPDPAPAAAPKRGKKAGGSDAAEGTGEPDADA